MKKLLGIIGIIIIVVDLILFSFMLISALWFWIIAALVAAFAWLILPKID